MEIIGLQSIEEGAPYNLLGNCFKCKNRLSNYKKRQVESECLSEAIITIVQQSLSEPLTAHLVCLRLLDVELSFKTKSISERSIISKGVLCLLKV